MLLRLQCGFLVGAEKQPDCFDLVRLPVVLYIRILICDATAAALENYDYMLENRFWGYGKQEFGLR